MRGSPSTNGTNSFQGAERGLGLRQRLIGRAPTHGTCGSSFLPNSQGKRANSPPARRPRGKKKGPAVLPVSREDWRLLRTRPRDGDGDGGGDKAAGQQRVGIPPTRGPNSAVNNSGACTAYSPPPSLALGSSYSISLTLLPPRPPSLTRPPPPKPSSPDGRPAPPNRPPLPPFTSTNDLLLLV